MFDGYPSSRRAPPHGIVAAGALPTMRLARSNKPDDFAQGGLATESPPLRVNSFYLLVNVARPPDESTIGKKVNSRNLPTPQQGLK